MAMIIVLLQSCIVLGNVVQNEIPAKHFKNVQGPPSEFALHELPNPSVGGVQSDSYLMAHKFKKVYIIIVVDFIIYLSLNIFTLIMSNI